MPQQKNDMLEPHNPGAYEILGKLLIGVMIGIAISFLTWIIILFSGQLLQQAITNQQGASTSPLIILIFIVIGFLGSFIGNTIISGLLNLVFSEKYYDISKMFTSIIVANLFIFIISIPFYLVYYTDTNQLFLVLAFHILFSVYASQSLIEFTTDPNYSSKHFLGTTIGLSISMTIFLLFFTYFKRNYNFENTKIILLFMPPLLAYTIIPFMHAIFEKIYFKLYETGNDFLYIPSLDDVLIEQEDDDEINVG